MPPITESDIHTWLLQSVGNYKGPLNLDALDENGLQLFIKFQELDKLDDGIDGQMALAKLLFCSGQGLEGIYPEFNPEETYLGLCKVISIYGRYARCKFSAIKWRKRGMIERAAMFEKWCEEDYSELPRFAKW